MNIFPAMDLFGGKIIRLQEGRFDQRIVYEADIEITARSFREAGAEWIHIIDLEGAKMGTPRHLHILKKFQGTGLKVQYGGGLRSEKSITSAFAAGAERIYMGSLLCTAPAMAKRLFSRYGERIIPAIDIRNGAAVISGWQEDVPRSPESLLHHLFSVGFPLFLVTAVHRDGTGSGPDRAMYRRLLSLFPGASFLAAGGISSLEDLRNLKADGLTGAVLGKALYEGKINLKNALLEAGIC